jgi:cardiolipin synthase
VRVVNIPNSLTVGRIILIPIFVTAMVYGAYRYGLYLFAVAALTDMLDGLFARLTNQKTVLGTFLDPLADKLLLITSFVLFAYNEWLPKWLAITVISRDLIVVIGWFLLYMVTSHAKVEPVLLGKTAIAMQLVLLSYVMLTVNFRSLPPVPEIVFIAAAAASVLSGIQYLCKGLRLAHAI